MLLLSVRFSRLYKYSRPAKYWFTCFQNQDASVEIYTLVESLVSGGPASGKLNIGDWIRSVNGTPIQIPVDVSAVFHYIT